MKELPTTTLIVATYNWPEALELCLHSCISQSVKPDEIIIADDGSTFETKNIIEHITGLTSIPMVHVWHEDHGFRLAAIRNKAIAAAQSDYIIQIDGDLILHKDFIKDHLTLAKTNQFVSGSRSLLNVSQSQKLLTSSPKVFKPRFLDYFHFGRRYYAIRSHLLNNLSEIFQARKNKYAYVLGANMAFWKKDLLLVNGYNEALTRTMTFTVLISANIFLTLINRSFYYSIFTTLRYKNKMVGWIILITIALMGLILFVKPLTAFFEFEALHFAQLLICIAIGFVSTAWFEITKWIKRMA